MNRLSKETSPYLLLHADNPVDWYPWNQEALDKAKQENKPILLSIGYAACHWCHVMAHESFEDDETAALMNKLFVNIKVDREERPDLDKIYQTAHYFLTQHNGGWPLTVFLTPNDLAPFFSGTYFPRETHQQLPSFKDVLVTIADIFAKSPDEIKKQNEQLLAILRSENPQPEKMELSDKPLQLANDFLKQKFDEKFGGFGPAPKFPHPPLLELLLQEKSPMAFFSLEKMADGGIYDQIGGGFFRYSVDAKWQIPHFEKMLYDNAQLLQVYAKASEHHPEFARIARETADWVIKKMQAPEGGYYSSLDADTQGKEGHYYIWNKFEIAELLSETEDKFAEIYFGLSESPNFEGQWHLHIAESLENTAKKLEMSLPDAEKMLQTIKTRLLNQREQRIPPARDQKILTSWNGLMIKAMLIAGHSLKEPVYVDSANRAIQFIQNNYWMNNRLKTPAFLDDYAFLLDALMTSFHFSENKNHLEFAKHLADDLLQNFMDSTNGGFYFTSREQEIVLYRPKTLMDEAIPSGNAKACDGLLALFKVTQDDRYHEAVKQTLRTAYPLLYRFPGEHASMLITLRNFLKN